MITYKAEIVDGFVKPSEGGRFTVLCGRGIVKVIDENGDDVRDFKFKEDSRTNRVELMSKKAGIEIDLNSLLCLPNKKERELEINRLEGMLYEEYVFKLISSKFSVIRQREVFPSLAKFIGRTSHNRPDFIVEGKIAVEAKVGEVNIEQIREYSRFLKKGIVAIAFYAQCSPPAGWICLQWIVSDEKRLLSYIESLLSR